MKRKGRNRGDEHVFKALTQLYDQHDVPNDSRRGARKHRACRERVTGGVVIKSPVSKRPQSRLSLAQEVADIMHSTSANHEEAKILANGWRAGHVRDMGALESRGMERDEFLQAARECFNGQPEESKPVGWSVLNPQSERFEISSNEELEMLRLSQSSVSEEPIDERANSEPSATPPKRKKKQKNRVPKRPRASNARLLSSTTVEEPRSKAVLPEELGATPRIPSDADQILTEANLPIVLSADDDDPLSFQQPKLTQKLRPGKKSDVDQNVVKRDVTSDEELQDSKGDEDASSFDASKNVLITVQCMDVSNCKRNKTEEERNKEAERKYSNLANPTDSGTFSPCDTIPKDKKSLETRSSTYSEEEEDAFREQAMENSRDQNEEKGSGFHSLQGDGRDGVLSDLKLEASIVPRNAKRIEEKVQMESSRKRCKRKSKRLGAHGLLPSVSPIRNQDAFISGEGHHLTKASWQFGDKLRKQLLECAKGNRHDLAEPREGSALEDSPRAGKSLQDAAAEALIVPSDSEEEHLQTAKFSRQRRTGSTVSKHARDVIGRESPEDTQDSDFHEHYLKELHACNRSRPASETRAKTENKKKKQGLTDVEQKSQVVQEEPRILKGWTANRNVSVKASLHEAVHLTEAKDVMKLNGSERRKGNSKGEQTSRQDPTKEKNPLLEACDASIVENLQEGMAKISISSATDQQRQTCDSKGTDNTARAADEVEKLQQYMQTTSTGQFAKDDTDILQRTHSTSNCDGFKGSEELIVGKDNANGNEECGCNQSAGLTTASCLEPSEQEQQVTPRDIVHSLSDNHTPLNNTNKSATDLVAGANRLICTKLAFLKSEQNAQSFDTEQRPGTFQTELRQPVALPERPNELDKSETPPGDLSNRNRKRTRRRRRRQRGIPETLPLLVQPRAALKKKNPQTENSQKTEEIPSSIVKVSNGCRSAAKLVFELSAVDSAEQASEQRQMTRLGEENKEKHNSANGLKANESLNPSPVAAEEPTRPAQAFVSSKVGERVENVITIDEDNRSDQNLKRHSMPLEDFASGLELNGPIEQAFISRKHSKDGQTKSLKRAGRRSQRLALKKGKSAEESLDELVDPKLLTQQSELLKTKSRRSRRTRVGGGETEENPKALDELSDNGDPKDGAWIPSGSSSTNQRSRTRISLELEPRKTHHMRTRGQASMATRAKSEVPLIIDLTDVGDDDTTVADGRIVEENDDIAESLKELRQLSLEDRKMGITDRPRCKYLAPLNEDELKLATDLTTRTSGDTKIVTIEDAKITLLGHSFKRLRGTRWLDDELINAYVSLINSRNNAVFEEMEEELRCGIPRTYVFNTFFFARLCSGSSGFDYPGVQGWTRRAKVDILETDIILVPINLGNHHWVLSGVDMEHREIMYLDSMHGPDKASAIFKLKKWVFEELRNKHGEALAAKLDPNSWKEVYHHYRIRRVGVLPKQLDPHDAWAGRQSRVPKQTDGGSCGVFTAKMADCLSLGVKVYFKQGDISLIRKRMALDLFRGYVPL